jgi:3-oxoacid CoA-transferase
MGGAMDLVSNPDATKIVVTTDHVDKYGVSKIITDLCVFQVDRTKGELTLTELAPGVTVDEIKEKTDAKFNVAEELGAME